MHIGQKDNILELPNLEHQIRFEWPEVLMEMGDELNVAFEVTVSEDLLPQNVLQELLLLLLLPQKKLAFGTTFF